MLEAVHSVREMLAREVPFEHIEAFIDHLDDLSDEERAVVWLLAWLGEGDPVTVATDLGFRPRPVVPYDRSAGPRGIEPVEDAGLEPLTPNRRE